jgi:hypothetical protein
MEVEDYFLLAFVFLIVFLCTTGKYGNDGDWKIFGLYYPSGNEDWIDGKPITFFIQNAAASFIRQVSISLTIGFAMAGTIKYILRKVKRR